MCLIALFLFPNSSYAFGIITKNDTGNILKKGPYYNADGDNIRIDYDSQLVKEHDIAFFHDAAYTQPGTAKIQKAPGTGWYVGFGFTCAGWYKFSAKDAQGKTLLYMEIRVDEGDLTAPACNSGGDDANTTPEVPEDKTCDTCGVFNCPGWDEHLGKLDDIKNAIPPPPNWNQVSQTFSDAIVPRLVSETKTMLDDLLGRAPSPPPTMPDLPPLDDHDFPDKQPTMPEVPGLSGFTENDVKSGAPVIPFEEDPTGGFNLTVDPVDNLPDVVPGGDPGIYKRDPNELPANYPGKPKETDVDMGGAPTPNDGGGKPPSPGDSGGTPPKPDDGVALPGKPDDATLPGKDHYMPKPGGG